MPWRFEGRCQASRKDERIVAVVNGEPTQSYRWWLHLQVGIGLLGGAAWFVGALLANEFVKGIGCGLLIAALLLRLGRKGAQASD